MQDWKSPRGVRVTTDPTARTSAKYPAYPIPHFGDTVPCEMQGGGFYTKATYTIGTMAVNATAPISTSFLYFMFSYESFSSIASHTLDTGTLGLLHLRLVRLSFCV